MCENCARTILGMALDAVKSKSKEEIKNCRSIIALQRKEFAEEVAKRRDDEELISKLEPFLDLIW